MSVYGWRIDRDYFWKEGDSVKSRVGFNFPEWEKNKEGKDLVRFRCLDDDGVVCYGGELIDDVGCESQEWALAFCMQDVGCTKIEVKRDGVWVQEIC